jgi:syntaxin 7
VNEIFKDLAVLVHEQGAMIGKFYLGFFSPNLACVQITSSIYFSLSLLLNFPFSGFVTDDIGSHIESAQAATSQGTSQLVKAAKTQRSNSSLVIYGISFIYSHFDYYCHYCCWWWWCLFL